MANEIKNRLQFVHCNTTFATREEAIAYVAGDMEAIQRPALYAEPMILRYGDKANPNIILAIGSKGDGVTASNSNKTFFIDFAKVNEDIEKILTDNETQTSLIEDLQSLMDKIIDSVGLNEDGSYKVFNGDDILKNAKSLNDADFRLSKAIQKEIERALEAEAKINKERELHTKESDTISFELNKNEEGTFLTGSVKVKDYKTVGEKNLPNQIEVDENGLYHYVDLSYNTNNSVLTFNVNGKVTKMNLPKEDYLVEGKYDRTTEEIVLTLKNGEEVRVDVSKLIGEWTVEGVASTTPVVLTKENRSFEDDIRGDYDYKDILKADVRIISELQPEVKDNILQRSGDGRSLYVKGTADNIKYYKEGVETTVQEAIDSIKCHVSSHEGNIILEKNDGLFANVDLEYVPSRNAIRFGKTNATGNLDYKEYTLNNLTFLDTIYYDSSNEEIVILYKDGNGETRELRIPVSSLFDEWDVENTNHTVTLNKVRNDGSGSDKLSADVNIASTTDNILRVVNHGLHVKGTSDNIKHGTSTVQAALDLLNGTEDTEGSVRNLIKKETDARISVDTDLENKISTEVSRAKAAEQANLDKINSEISRAKAAEQANTNAIETEVSRAKAEEKRIEDKFDVEITKQSTVNTQITGAITKLQSDLASEVKRSTDKDAEIELSVEKEKERAVGEEQRIETAFTAFKENSERQHTELGGRVTSVETALTKETEDRIKNDQLIGTALTEEISRATNAESKLTSDLASLSEKVTTNTNNITTVTEGLTSLNQKIDNEITRATNAENAISISVSEEKAARENKDTELSSRISANTTAIENEVTRATAAETSLDGKISANTTAIENEVTRATAAEKVNSDAISALDKKTTMTANNSGTINLTKTVLENGEGYTLSAQVNVANELGNIINSDGTALKAMVDLVYDGSKNTLTLKTSNNADKVIALNQGSIITNIEYKADEKKLVIHYIDAQSQPQNVEVNVADLFNEVTVENPAGNAVALSISDKADGSKVITADVNVATVDTNLLTKSNGNLYVSNAASGIKFDDGKTVVEKFNTLNQSVTTHAAAIANNTTAISDEKTAREAADKALSNRIDAIESKDITVDGTIQGIKDSITQEINDRTAADTALGVRIDNAESLISTETTNRTNADTALEVRIVTLETNLPKEVQNRTDADDVLRTSIQDNTKAITEETSKRQVEDLALSGRIDTVQNNIDAEKQRAISEEGKLSDRIGVNAEKLSIIEPLVNSHNISIATINEKIATNTSAITSEIQNRENEDAKINVALNSLNDTVTNNKKELTCSVKNTGTIELIKEPNTAGDGYMLSGKVKVSNAANNIINQTDDSLYASVDLTYDSERNVLTFTTSGDVEKEITLNAGSLINDIELVGNELVIKFTTAQGVEKEVKVNVADLFNDWNVENEVNSPLQLDKTTNSDGTSTLKAQIRISNNSNSLLKNNGGFLEVSNAASGIKFEDGENLVQKNKTLTDNLSSEIQRATTIESGLRIDVDAIKLKSETNATDISKLQEKQTEISTTISTEIDKVTCITENTDSLNLTKTTEGVEKGYKISGKVNVSPAEGNIIQPEGPLFASVRLDYDNGSNLLTLVTSNGGTYQHKLNVGSTITEISYDSSSIELVIHYTDAEGNPTESRVDASSFINEWVVSERGSSPVKLTKTEGGKGEPDVLSAEIMVSALPDNMLVINEGNLHVSNAASGIKLADSAGGGDVETAIVSLRKIVDSAESTVEDFTEKVTELETIVNEHTTLIQNNKNDVDAIKIKVNKIELENSEIKQEFTEINNRLDGVDASINDINTNIDSLEKEFENFQERNKTEAVDTNTVDMTFTYGVDHSTIKADVKISSEEDNLITVKDDGLHVLEDYDFGTY